MVVDLIIKHAKNSDFLDEYLYASRDKIDEKINTSYDQKLPPIVIVIEIRREGKGKSVRHIITDWMSI